jgi:hypothetical protein
MRYFLVVSKIPEGKSELSWALDESLFEAIGANYDIEQLRGVLLVHLQKDAQYLRLEVLVEGEATVPCDRC